MANRINHHLNIDYLSCKLKDTPYERRQYSDSLLSPEPDHDKRAKYLQFIDLYARLNDIASVCCVNAQFKYYEQGKNSNEDAMSARIKRFGSCLTISLTSTDYDALFIIANKEEESVIRQAIIVYLNNHRYEIKQHLPLLMLNSLNGQLPIQDSRN